MTGITGTHRHTWLIFVFLVEMEFCHVGQAGLKPLTSSDLLASASLSAGITGLSHHAQSVYMLFYMRETLKQIDSGDNSNRIKIP